MAPNAFATGGSLSSTNAVTTVAASPTAICRNETARRFSLSAHAIASNASTPNADCSCSMNPPPTPGSDYASAGRPRNAVLRACPLTSASRSATRLSMSSTMPVVGRELLRHGPFLFFLLSRSLSRFASQIAAVAIGWQVYDITGSAFQLGMVGLVQFLPTALLVFVAGHAADRFERKRVVQLCQIAEAATALFLAVSTFAGWLTVPQIFFATFVIGI